MQVFLVMVTDTSGHSANVCFRLIRPVCSVHIWHCYWGLCCGTFQLIHSQNIWHSQKLRHTWKRKLAHSKKDFHPWYRVNVGICSRQSVMTVIYHFPVWWWKDVTCALLKYFLGEVLEWNLNLLCRCEIYIYINFSKKDQIKWPL